ncbi:MAG: hypothetical protein OHK0023_04660 [Anaerolineae bacterium]
MCEAVYLYVEDDPLSQEIMKMIVSFGLAASQLTVFTNSHNFMARVKALVPEPTVFLLDIHIEPHNGFELLKMLREDPQFKACPIIALTASVMNEEVAQLRRSGFDGAIGKPLSVQTFPKLMKRILDGESVWHIA